VEHTRRSTPSLCPHSAPRSQEIDVKFLSDKLPRELMLEHRAQARGLRLAATSVVRLRSAGASRTQIFETLGLQKQLISLRRSSRVYKHISVVDLKARLTPLRAPCLID